MSATAITPIVIFTLFASIIVIMISNKYSELNVLLGSFSSKQKSFYACSLFF